jgi:hypothetical protein
MIVFNYIKYTIFNNNNTDRSGIIEINVTRLLKGGTPHKQRPNGKNKETL